MAKIVFALKNTPFYENLPHRRSYISVKDGVIDQSLDTMLKNQDKYLSPFFPTQTEINNITNKHNYSYIDYSTRTAKINVKIDYPDKIYTTDYSFWSNVSYAKIIHDRGFIEYFYVKERTCGNEASNVWQFTFHLDIWNTYWVDTYQNYLNNVKKTKKPLSIVRWHENRFYKISYAGADNWVFKFLVTQDTSFWNKESFESDIKSSIITGTGKSFTPWQEFDITDTNLMYGADFLKSAYSNRLVKKNVDGPHPPTFGFNSGFLTAFINTTPENTLKPWLSLTQYNGLLNSYWVAPVMGDVLSREGEIWPLSEKIVLMFGKGDRDLHTENLIYNGNRIENLISAPQLGTIIQSPKPTYIFQPFSVNNILEWNMITYPIRYRGRYASNNNKKYNKWDKDYFVASIPLKLGEKNINTVVLSDSHGVTFNDGIYNQANRINSMNNAMCDERIDLSNFVNQLWINKKNERKRQDFNIWLEPKIFDDEITHIKYMHYNQESISISFRWYFYQNWDDLFKYKSIFLYGYQFIQPHLVGLFQMPAGGIYTNTIFGASNVLSTFFSPNQQTTNDAQKTFLTANRSQMNTALNNQKQNSLFNTGMGIPSTLSATASGFVWGGPVGAMLGAGTGATSAIFGAIKSGMQYNQMKASQDAKIQDLGNTPNNTSDPVTESTFKLLNSYDGIYQIKSISDIDKFKIWTYHAENGYLLNKQVIVNSFATRIYYNFWQFPNFKFFLPELNIINQYKEYFENLFDQGITLWHDYSDTKLEIEQNEIGLYTWENWETDIYT